MSILSVIGKDRNPGLRFIVDSGFFIGRRRSLVVKVEMLIINKDLHEKRETYPPMEYSKKLNQYFIGWCGYFALADISSVFVNLVLLIRRGLRICIWKDWKLPREKVRKIKGLYISIGKPLNETTHEKVTLVNPKSPYYTEPLEIPPGITKGLKVYQYVI